MYIRKEHGPRECEICGAVYIPLRSNQRTCGDPECKRAIKNIKQNKWRKQNYNMDTTVSESRTPKEDTIVAIGYAERQIEKTLSMVPKIDTTL